MRDVLILSEGAVPDGLTKANRWPELRVNVAAGLTPGGLASRLASAGNSYAVIVNAATPNSALSKALTNLACKSVEIRLTNPHRDPDLSAETLGADALIFGLGKVGFETALSLLTDRRAEPAA